jgi:hypothetical protein
VAIVVAGCANDLGCDLDGVSRDVGGTGLMDCGIAKPDKTDTVDRCAVTAFGRGQTFRAIYEQDDESVEAVVHGSGDHYYLLHSSAGGDHVERADCKSASIVDEGSRRFVQCEHPSAFRPACD